MVNWTRMTLSWSFRFNLVHLRQKNVQIQMVVFEPFYFCEWLFSIIWNKKKIIFIFVLFFEFTDASRKNQLTQTVMKFPEISANLIQIAVQNTNAITRSRTTSQIRLTTEWKCAYVWNQQRQFSCFQVI